MKKLNKKGFTLVELLAVIVILAVIMVITIPTVLSSMNKATDSAFESAVAAVQKYIDDQVTLCQAGLGDMGPTTTLNFTTGTCTVATGEETNILANAGYTGKMTISLNGNKITYASGLDEFDGKSYTAPVAGNVIGG